MKNILCLLILISFMTSCAVTRDHISVQYEAVKDVAKVERAETIPIKVQVNDNRASKERVSRKKNNYGIDCASIMCTNDLGELVKEVISQELYNRGFTLSPENLSSILIDVDLLKFYNDFKPGFFAGKGISEVTLFVKVQRSDQSWCFSKAVSGVGINRNVMLYSGHNAKIGLEEALKTAISNLMNDTSFMESLLQDQECNKL